jgi:cytochrome oxidase assembly protein ShyY1
VYRFLLTPRWLGLACLTVALTAVMALAGHWQLDRYHLRSATNARIDAARTATPVPLGEALPAPRGAGTAGPAAPAAAEWSRVTMTGRYDGQRQILARGRTVNGQVGFEVITPFVLADGGAVLVDRGWIAATPGDASARPAVPPAPVGEVSASGRLVRPESGASRLRRVDGRIEVRRISPTELAAELPYPVYGSYVLLDPASPGGGGLAAVPSRRENAWQNAGYMVQWWLFAAMTLVGFGWLARREAHGPQAPDEDRAAEPAEPGGPGGPVRPAGPAGPVGPAGSAGRAVPAR